MKHAVPRLVCLSALALAGAVNASGSRPPPSLAERLTLAAPEADAAALGRAAAAMACASANDASPPRRLAVIDYSLPSTQRRLWLFDLDTATLLDAEWVAHGRGSGDDRATSFSNRPGSHQSSLGLFRTGATYIGRNGYSLRLDGLEPGINDRARERAVVIHGASYVSEHTIASLGRLGRSWGCPALRNEVARHVIDELADGQYVYAYFPDAAWLGSQASGCASASDDAARPDTVPVLSRVARQPADAGGETAAAPVGTVGGFD